MMRPTDRIIGPARGDAATVRSKLTAWGTARVADTEAYIAEVFRLAPAVGIDPSVVIAQWHLESDSGRSSHWREKLNPGGIGVTDGGDVSIDYRTGASAARGQLLHLWAYATTARVPAVLTPYMALDPRFKLVRRGAAPTIQGLQGRWATDPNYAAKLCARGNLIWPDVPEQEAAPEPKPTPPRVEPKPGPTPKPNMTKGLVPMPPFAKRLILDKPPGVGYDNLGPREVWGATRHRMQGTLWGTDGYFRQAGVRALTDFGLDHQTAELLMWCDPFGGMTPWASGPVSAPYGDGAAFLAKWQARYGPSVVNRMRVSVELAGFFAQPGSNITADSPWSDLSKRRFAQAMAHYAHDYGIAWSDFPNHPNDGFSFLCDHVEFTKGTGKICPGSLAIAETGNVIQLTVDILRAAQAGSVKPPVPPAGLAYPEGMDRDLAIRMFGRVESGGVPYAFDERGPVSRLWLDLGITHEPHLFPELERVEKGTKGEYFFFDNGMTIYRKDNKGAFRTIGDDPIDAERAA